MRKISSYEFFPPINSKYLYLVLQSRCYQKKLECSEPATDSLLIHIRKQSEKYGRKWQHHIQIGSVHMKLVLWCSTRAWTCKGLHGSESFLMHKLLSLEALDLGCMVDPLFPRLMLKTCMYCLGNRNFLTTVLTLVYYVKEKPHFSLLRLSSERSFCK